MHFSNANLNPRFPVVAANSVAPALHARILDQEMVPGAGEGRAIVLHAGETL